MRSVERSPEHANPSVVDRYFRTAPSPSLDEIRDAVWNDAGPAGPPQQQLRRPAHSWSSTGSTSRWLTGSVPGEGGLLDGLGPVHDGPTFSRAPSRPIHRSSAGTELDGDRAPGSSRRAGHHGDAPCQVVVSLHPQDINECAFILQRGWRWDAVACEPPRSSAPRWLLPNLSALDRTTKDPTVKHVGSFVVLAVAVGFEPTVELPPHTLSRRAP